MRSLLTRPLLAIVCGAVLAAAAGGCSSSSTTSGLSLVDEQGNHPANWVAAHPGFALPDGGACVACHGSVTSAAESGGISGVSCFLASRDGQGCHAGGPTFTGVHAVPYLAAAHFQADNTTFTDTCSNCHAIASPDTSPLAGAPLCTECHGVGEAQPLLAQSPLDFPNCTSCHAAPPNGVTYPNVAGSHGLHNAFPGVTGVCDSCHNGLGSGTLAHYNRANARPGRDALRVPPGDVAFLPNFNSPTGAASFDNVALTCANVTCHGGQTTPPWQGGALDVNAQCEDCHALGAASETPQFNSFFSGRHFTHVPTHIPNAAPGVVPPCLACHDTATLAVQGAHFGNLATTAIDTRADVTIGGATTLVTTYVPGATVGFGTCTPNDATQCHAPFPWSF